MTRRPDQLHPDVEADVADRLARALHGGPADVVDVTALAAGTRCGIARAAVRRRATVLAAAVAAVAVPFGVAVLGPGGASRGIGPASTVSSPATGSPTQSATAPPTAAEPPTDTPTTDPTTPATSSPASPVESPAPDSATAEAPADPNVVPLDSLATDDDPNHVAYVVPDVVALAPTSDFGRPMVQLLDIGNYRWQPTVSGQACGGAHDPMPVAARQWMWAEEDSNRFDQLGVTLIVSGWQPGTTSARFADIRQDDGVCHWLDTPTRVSTAGMPGDEAWAATFVQNGLPAGRAAVRVGDVIVSVEVFHPDGRTAAVALAKELAGTVADRVRTSGLAATAAAGG